MYTIKVWWAGHCLRNRPVKVSDALSDTLQQLQHELNAGEITLTTCGVTITPDTVCVDAVAITGALTQYIFSRNAH
jgi:hypothetical protein